MTSDLTRRGVLRASGYLAALAALPGCDGLYTALARAREDAPGPVELANGAAVDPGFHFLNRVTYGPRPGSLARLRRMGRAAWLDEQLDPGSIDDSACDVRTSQCASVGESPAALMSVRERHISRDLVRDALIRAVHSRRELQEVMVGFWRDHLSIDFSKDGCETTKPQDDREVLRKHALGRFRELIRASALSPAMLTYLDGRMNRRASADEKPNENYARELLELHTLGVHGGYSQTDVMEAARCLTGWTTERRRFQGLQVVFHSEWHDDGQKVVLGETIPAGGGEADLERLIDIVCKHDATARHLAWKLCRRFVGDRPPEALVETTAAVFRRTDGDIQAVLRHILSTDAFAASPGQKIKRPLRFIASALRATGAECRAGKRELEFLERMGHVPFHYPTPDGYPEEPEPWMGGMLWRWSFSLALVGGKLDRTEADIAALVRRAGMDPVTCAPADVAPLFLGRAATADERAVVTAYAEPGGRDRRVESLALLLSSPGFQVH